MKLKFNSFISALLGLIIGAGITLAFVLPKYEKVNEKLNVSTKEKIENKINESKDFESKSLKTSNLDFANVYKNIAKEAMPSVVGITTVFLDNSTPDDYFDFFFGRGFNSSPQIVQGLGTGVIVDKTGYILTNSHVVQDGNADKVNVLFNDGSTKEAEVKWFDTNFDLAIIKVDGEEYKPISLGDSSLVEVGDIAVAIGNPLGLEFERTVTQGIISGVDRTVHTQNSTMSNLLQTDASINGGNSGGPLLNIYGEVIGINTIKAVQGEGLGFAIPINTAKVFINMIKEKGEIKEKPILGIQGISISSIKDNTDLTNDEKDGVLVAGVYKYSPADLGKLKKGDIIKKVNEDPIKNMTDLEYSLYKYGQDLSKPVEITVKRNKKELVLKLKLKTQEELLKEQEKHNPLSFFENGQLKK